MKWFENVLLCDRRLAKELGEDYVDGVGLTDDPNGDTRPIDVYAAKKPPKCIKSFDEIENTRTEDCRDWIR